MRADFRLRMVKLRPEIPDLWLEKADLRSERDDFGLILGLNRPI